MVGRLILGLIWLTCVQSDSMPIEDASINKMQMTMPESDESSGVASITKTKRYLSHGHSSPCPPFYPHFGMHMPMYAMRPYGPPAYPKSNVHMPIYQEQHHHYQAPQFIHQPSYASYVPKQTVQYVKPAPPVYHHPIVSPPIHPIVKHPLSYYHYQQPMIEHHKPIFSYAPAYNKPMPIWQGPEIKKIDYPIHQVSYQKPPMPIWQGPEIKKIDYPIHQVSYQKPSIVYKPEVPKCAPCPSSNHQPQQPQYHHQQPTISYVKIAQPIVQKIETPSKVYLPAPVHHPKPCDK